MCPASTEFPSGGKLEDHLDSSHTHLERERAGFEKCGGSSASSLLPLEGVPDKNSPDETLDRAFGGESSSVIASVYGHLIRRDVQNYEQLMFFSKLPLHH